MTSLPKAEPLDIVSQRSEACERRFCGRCQSWLRDAIELHHCVRAPRLIGYAWYEPDEPAFEKNDILHEGRKFKPGTLIVSFPAAVGDEA